MIQKGSERSMSGHIVDAAESIGTWLNRIAADELFARTEAADTARLRQILPHVPLELLLDAVTRRAPGSAADVEIVLYQTWIEVNTGTSPLLFAAWFNLGVTLARIGDRANAMIAYRNALALKPDLYAASINLGLLHEAMGEPQIALHLWEQALQPDETRVALLIQRGRLLETLGVLPDAEKALRAALTIDPTRPDVIHHWVHLRQKLCAWPVIQPPTPAFTPDTLLAGCGPLGLLALSDDIAVQSAAAASWISRKTKATPQLLAPKQGYLHDRIRIGYLSSDFCRHAMSFLIAELFERHDRERFEVYGYCASRDDGSEIRQRVIKAFDHYRAIRELTDEQAAQVIRHDEIDILIDLNGLTDGTRLELLRWKPAPVQITYLGFIGAVPLPELDYMLCDDFVIPPNSAHLYGPTPLPIPHLFQANDSKRGTGRPMSRTEAGLPEDRFVFCCFSRHYKITEEMFGSWMEILRESENSVLWLARDTEWSEASLRNATVRAGIASERLIFAERIDPDLYMSRLRLADLFLDTFPYNAGTVASDALRMELPLLTLCGQSFVSRMAGSLLTALGVPEAIAISRAEYVSKAIHLSKDADAYRSFRAGFTHAAWASSIGDIGRFTADLEDTLSSVVVRRADASADLVAAI
jgi:predicted O-linked N-acetylglucosamine transferase (SPINDLY family)